MNIEPAERVDILCWLNRFELDAVAFSSKFFWDIVVANRGVLPLRRLESVVVRRLTKDEYIVEVTAKSALNKK